MVGDARFGCGIGDRPQPRRVDIRASEARAAVSEYFG